MPNEPYQAEPQYLEKIDQMPYLNQKILEIADRLEEGCKTPHCNEGPIRDIQHQDLSKVKGRSGPRYRRVELWEVR